MRKYLYYERSEVTDTGVFFYKTSIIYSVTVSQLIARGNLMGVYRILESLAFPCHTFSFATAEQAGNKGKPTVSVGERNIFQDIFVIKQ